MAGMVRRAVLGLYRAVLRVNRTSLPAPLRAMGDAYARDEFRRHRDAKTTPAQWRTFFKEWRRYVGMLRGEADLTEDTSGEIPADALAALSPEQQARLAELRNEAQRARAEILAGASPPLPPPPS